MHVHSWLRKLIGRSQGPALRRRQLRLHAEELERRLTPAVTDMTQLAQLFPTPSTPQILALNFDGWTNVPGNVGHNGSTILPFSGTQQQIQDIIYQVAEIYAPFNVEVFQVFGNGFYWTSNPTGASNGVTTIFIGGNPANTNSSGVKYVYNYTPSQYVGYPGAGRGNGYVPHSDPYDLAYVDPLGASGNISDTGIAEAVAHESGHTFGLAHDRSDGLTDPAPIPFDGTVPDIMSYDSSNQYFANQTLPETNFNYNGTSTTIAPGLQPNWHGSNIVTQNSYTFLQAILGTRPSDGDFHVVHAGNVDTTSYSVFPLLGPNYTVGNVATDTLSRAGDYNMYETTAPSLSPLYSLQVSLAPVASDPTFPFDPELLVYDQAGNLVQAVNATLNPSTGFHEIHEPINLTAGSEYSFVVGSVGGGNINQNSSNAGYTFQISEILNIPKFPPFHFPLPISLAPTTLPAWTVNRGGYSQVLSATGGNGGSYTFKVTSGGLPPGLVLSTGGGLSGTPTSGGSYNFTVTATDSSSDSGSQAYTVIINPALHLMVSGGILPGQWTAGLTGLRLPWSITGGTESFTVRQAAGVLPPGLMVQDDALIGTPTMPGTYNYTVLVRDAVGAMDTESFTLQVNPPVTISTSALDSWTVNQPGYMRQIMAMGGTLMHPTDSLSYHATGLPPGMMLSSTGLLSGTPTSPGTYNVSLLVVDILGAMSTKTIPLTVNMLLSLIPMSLPDWTVGALYFQTLLHSPGGTGPATFQVTVGSLPPGLNLSNGYSAGSAVVVPPGNGVASGTPTMTGLYSFKVTVTDSTGASASQSYGLTINPAVTITTTTLADGMVNQLGYGQIISATGGTGTKAFALKSGVLPPGLTLSSGGVLSGKPTAAGSFGFVVSATDTVGATALQTFSLTITSTDTLKLRPYLQLQAAVNQPAYNETIYATGGVAPYTFATTSGMVPPGFSLNPDGVLFGTPSLAGTYTFTVEAVDSVGNTGSQTYEVVVNPDWGITTTTLPAWTVGHAGYDQAIDTTGGTQNGLTYFTSGGELPPGLSLGSNGGIAGTPTKAGTFNFTVAAGTYITLDYPAAAATHIEGISGNSPDELIAGWYSDTSNHGFVFDVKTSTWTILNDPDPATTGTYVQGITGNASAGYQVTGYYTAGSSTHGFIYDGTTWTNFDDPAAQGETNAYGISAGVIVGSYFDGTGVHGFIHNTPGSTWTTLNDPLATGNTIATGVFGNIVIGTYQDAIGTHGFSYNVGTGTYTTIDDPAANPGETVVYGFDGSHVAGYFINGAETHGFIYNMTSSPPTYTATFDFPAGLYGHTFAEGVGGDNVVGGYIGVDGHFHGFMFYVPQIFDVVSYSVVINSDLTFGTPSLANGTAGAAYSEGISASGGTGGLAFSAAGALPAGLDLSTDGMITGTPSTPGTYTFAVASSDELYAGGGSFLPLDDPLATAGTFAQGVSSSNVVVGYYQDTGGAHGFSFDGIGYTTLDDPNATGGTFAEGVSGTTIAGYYVDGAGTHGFTFDGTTYTTLDDPQANPGTTLAYGISGNTVVGTYQDAAGSHGFFFDGTTWAPLDDPLATEGTFAQAISGSTIVGFYRDSGGTHGFEYSGLTYTSLDDPAADPGETFATGVSGNDIVGYYYVGTAQHGFVFDGATYSTLDDSAALPGYSSASGISGRYGVGTYDDGAGIHGFMYEMPVSRDYTVVISAAAAITSPSVPNGTVNRSYAQQVNASGGTGTLTFSAAGVLPTGLNLSSSGLLSGTPTAAGTYTFTVTVTDSTASKFSQAYTVTIYPAVGITTPTLANGISGTHYYQTIATTGGSGGLTYSATENLPPGLSLSSSGLLAGTPTAPGTYSFTVTTADSLSADGTFVPLNDPLATAGTHARGVSGPEVVGYYRDATGDHGFLYNGATYTKLDDPAAAPGTTFAQAVSGNNVVGWYMDASSMVHGFLYSGSTWTNLDDPGASGGTFAQGISGSDIVGYFLDAAGTHGFLFNGSTWTTLDDPAATNGATYAYGVDGANIVGYYQDTIGYHGFLYNGSTYSNYDVPGADAGTTTAYAISGNTILGDYDVVVGDPGYLYNGTSYLTVDNPAATAGTTVAYGISGNEVVGEYQDATGFHGFSFEVPASQQYTVVISAPLAITTPSLPGGIVGTGYSQTIGTSGGSGTPTFSSTGTLPTGLTLSSAGVLSGTPTAAGTYNFTVTAADALNSLGTFSPLDDPSATAGTFAQSMSGSNVVGSYQDGAGSHGFVYNGTTFTTLDDPAASVGNTYAQGISGGTIVGWYVSPTGGTHGFSYNGSTWTTLDEPEATNGTYVEGISGSTIVGSYVDGSGTHGFVFNGTTWTTLDDPAAPPGNTQAYGISGSDVAGTYVDGSGTHGFLYNGSTYSSINYPTATGGTSVQGILGNDIVGYYLDGAGAHGFWYDGSTYTSLDDPAATPGHTFAVGISSSGIVGYYQDASGTHGFTYGISASQSYTVTINPAPVVTYQVTIIGPSSVQAGSPIAVTVQAVDGMGNPVTSYSGPATATVSLSSSSAANTFPGAVAINNAGFGFFVGTVQKVGAYTIMVANSSIAGSTNSPVTVTAGPAAKLAFAAQPANTPTGVTLTAVTVQVQDAYGNLVTSDNSDQVTVGIASGPGLFLAGSTTTATVASGVATFANLILVKPGSYTLSEEVPTLYSGPNSATFTIAPLQVVPGSFTGSPSGFSLQFNAPFLVNSITPVLYGQGFGATAPVPSVTLTQTKDGSDNAVENVIAGSLVLNAATNSITFVASNTTLEANDHSPLLPDGTYNVVVHSSATSDGFQALTSGGGFLDGLNSGTPGSGDFTATFTVGASHDDALWVPATADGPGQPLEAPGKNQIGGGYPVYLSDATGTVSNVQAMLTYNPTLLTIAPSSTSTFTVTVPTPGMALLQYSGPPLPTGTQTPIGFIAATVPAGTTANPTPYKGKDLMQLSSISLNGGTIPGLASDALHLVAYVGDADGNGGYSSSDAVLITRALLSTDSGFAAYPLVDPVILADTDGTGFIPADAALQANEAGVGFPTANLPIPPIPGGVVFQPIANNVDPSLSIPTNPHVGPNGAVMVPVNIDDAHPAGSTGLIRANLALAYDPRQFTVSAADVHPGSLLSGGNWSIVPTIDQATGQIGIALSSSTPLTSTNGGSLITIEYHRTGTTAGPVPFELVASADPNGQYVATELEDAQGIFTLSPAPTNDFDPHIDGLVMLAPALATTPVVTPGLEVAAFASTTTRDIQPADGHYAQNATIVESADPSVDAAPIEGSEREAAATPAMATVNVGAFANFAAIVAGSSFAAMSASTSASPLGGLVLQVGGSLLGIPVSASPRPSDQFFQAHAHWFGGPTDTVLTSTVNDSFARILAGQLLPLPPMADSLDNLNWDEVSSDLNWEGIGDPLTWPGGSDTSAYQPHLQSSEPVALERCFAQMVAELDQIADSD